ncbi:Maltase-glucoamylase, intestinal, partial [Orchesella cincta]
ATKEAIGQRTYALSRSSFLGLGDWVTHLLGDNFSNWPNMHRSIIGVLQFNINHKGNGHVEQDPTAFNGEIIESTKKALTVRYTLLPYLYSLLARHERWGDTVARPVWSAFPTDSVALGIDRQFMWGSGILISPVLDEDQTTVQAYFPDSRFYDYYTGAEVSVRGNWTTLDAPLDFINVHVHGGSIIVTQVPALNTDAQRNNPLGLILALDDNGEASGSYLHDDEVSFDTVANRNYFIAQMAAANKTLEYVAWMNQYPGMGVMIVDTIRLLGASPAPTSITVNGEAHTNFEVVASGEVVIRGLNHTANVDFVLQYN